MINLIISDKEQESGDKEYTLKDIKELEKFKNETALSIYIGECKKIEELDIIYNTFHIIDALRIFYLLKYVFISENLLTTDFGNTKPTLFRLIQVSTFVSPFDYQQNLIKL